MMAICLETLCFGHALNLEHDYIQGYERYFLQRSFVLSDMSTTRNRDTRDAISQVTSFQKAGFTDYY